MLLEAPGIDVKLADKDRDSALAIASREGHTEMVQLLLGVPGIDANAVNNYGKDAAQLADKYGASDEGHPGHAEVLEMLEQAGTSSAPRDT